MSCRPYAYPIDRGEASFADRAIHGGWGRTTPVATISGTIHQGVGRICEKTYGGIFIERPAGYICQISE